MRLPLNPFRLGDSVRSMRTVIRDGGPRLVRLCGVGQPEGLLILRSRFVLEVESQGGAVARFEPQLPVPFLYAWAYRLGRRFHVPLVSDFDPERLSFQVTLPWADGDD